MFGGATGGDQILLLTHVGPEDSGTSLYYRDTESPPVPASRPTEIPILLSCSCCFASARPAAAADPLRLGRTSRLPEDAGDARASRLRRPWSCEPFRGQHWHSTTLTIPRVQCHGESPSGRVHTTAPPRGMGNYLKTHGGYPLARSYACWRWPVCVATRDQPGTWCTKCSCHWLMDCTC